MAIVAPTYVLLTGLLLPAVPSVVRVAEPAPVSGMEEVAETTVVPVVAEVITTVQLAVEPPPVRSEERRAGKESRSRGTPDQYEKLTNAGSTPATVTVV